MAFQENLKTGQAYRVLVDQDALTGINTYDRLSFWTSASDVQITETTTLQDVSGAFYYSSGVLAAGETTVVISDSNINEDALIDIYVPEDDCKVTPDTITTESGIVTITFPPQDHPMEVRIVCKNLSPRISS